MLTFDRVQNSVVQGLPARVVGGGADACSTAVGQSVSDGLHLESSKRYSNLNHSKLFRSHLLLKVLNDHYYY